MLYEVTLTIRESNVFKSAIITVEAATQFDAMVAAGDLLHDANIYEIDIESVEELDDEEG